MLLKQTLFVVGAGASAEYSFPVGYQLKEEISGQLMQAVRNLERKINDGSSVSGRVAQAILHYAVTEGRKLPELMAKAKRAALAMSMAPSIDMYIENHSHDPDIAFLGKLGIAECLLTSEGKSPLAVASRDRDATINFGAISDKWLTQLFQILVEGQKIATLETLFQNVAFVVFNYDRCIEHYFQHSIASYFNVSLAKAAELVRGCRIVHPYGSLGPRGYDHRMLGFGGAGLSPVTPEQLVEIALHNLRTYSEYIEDADEVERNKALLAGTETIVYLGFAFHQQNVKLLTTIVPKKRCPVLATVFNVPPPAHEVISTDMGTIMKVNLTSREPTLADLECGKFLTNYRLLLSKR